MPNTSNRVILAEKMMKNNCKAHSLKMGFIMDPMNHLVPDDSSLLIMQEAQKRGHTIYYIEPHDLFAKNINVLARAKQVQIREHEKIAVLKTRMIHLKQLDVLFNRKDPPF